MLYDSLLIIAIWMATLLAWVIANDGKAVEGIIVQAVLALELLGFYLYFWSRQGQTLGMTAWRIKLVDADGSQPLLKQLVVRLLTAPLSIACVGVGYLWLYVGDARQTWHDRLSGTMVVHIPKS
jgi:uncharacterized RDD family membrane protein YckC